MTWTHLDTFSGIGGFALAAAWTGRIQTVQFVEIDPWCRRVLVKHWPGVPIHDDIRTFLADPVCERGRQERGSASRHEATDEGRTTQHDYQPDGGGQSRLDLLTGGFPCQPFSAAGKRQGQSDDRYLWPELARVIRCARPRWCLLENVPGIIGLAGGLDRILADLGEEGYTTGTVAIPAAAVGAYHKRERVWIIAALDDSEGAGRGVSHALNQWTSTGDEHASGNAGAVADPALRGLRRGCAPGGTGLAAQRGQDAADAEGTGLQECRGPSGARTRFAGLERGDSEWNGHETLSRLGDAPDGLPRWLDERPAFGPDWESGIPRVTAHEEDRVNKLKALGNSIVPQVAYELLIMMLAVDDGQEVD